MTSNELSISKDKKVNWKKEDFPGRLGIQTINKSGLKKKIEANETEIKSAKLYKYNRRDYFQPY